MGIWIRRVAAFPRRVELETGKRFLLEDLGGALIQILQGI